MPPAWGWRILSPFLVGEGGAPCFDILWYIRTCIQPLCVLKVEVHCCVVSLIGGIITVCSCLVDLLVYCCPVSTAKLPSS